MSSLWGVHSRYFSMVYDLHVCIAVPNEAGYLSSFCITSYALSTEECGTDDSQFKISIGNWVYYIILVKIKTFKDALYFYVATIKIKKIPKYRKKVA